MVPKAKFWHNSGMPNCAEHNAATTPRPDPAAQSPASPATPSAQPKPKEIGGPSGPEPTRYGDWEKKGRCIDF